MSQITILSQAHVPMGPFTRAQVADKLQSGEVTMASLAYAEGFSEWTPLRDVLGRIDAALPPVPSAPLAGVPATSAGAYSYAATMAPPAHLQYGGFWLRFVAVIIDTLILNACFGVLALILVAGMAAFGGVAALVFSSPSSTSSDNPALGIGVGLLAILAEFAVVGGIFVVTWFYYAKQESGPHQATIGKRVMGLRVTDVMGRRISFARASGRFFAKIISKMIFYIGYIMAGFTERKQALHDLIADTLVVKV